MKRVLASRSVLGSVLVMALVLASILLAAVLDSKDAGDATPPFNETLFKKLMSGQFTSLEDLVQDYPDDYANDLDVFTCSDLIEFWWDWADTISVSGTNYVEWTDTGATGVSPRFYAAGNAQTNGVTDPDSDGLTWAREKYMYHTCPTNWDSDGDTLSDYEEVISLNTDPNNDDTNRPTAAMVFPPDGYRWVWMP